MNFAWCNRLKRTIAGILAFILLFYSSVGIAWAEESIEDSSVTEESEESDSVECAHLITQIINAADALCEQDGYTGDTVCEECGAVVSAGNIVPALGHVWDEGILTTEAGCESDGEKFYTCETDTSHTKTEIIPAKGHQIEDYVCINCGQKYGWLRLVPQSQPIAGEEFKVDVILERNPGITFLKIKYEYDTDRLELINVEDKKLLTETAEFTEEYLLWEELQSEADYTETGVIATLTMKAKEGVYGTTDIKVTEIEASDINSEKEEFKEIEDAVIDVGCGHEWNEGEVTTAATCESDGVKTFTCKIDSSHTKTEVIPKLGHVWDAGVITTKASCESDGVKIFTCQNDSSHTYTEVIKKTGHNWNAGVITTEATCEADGERTYTCQNDSSHKRTETIEKLEHDYAIIEYKEPTTKKDGYEKYQCTRCKHEYTETIEKLGTGGNVEYEYDDASGATSDSLTFYVGYFGMDYVKKTTLTLEEIMAECPMVTQTFSYINKRPRVVYDVATGPTFTDVMDLAGVDMGAAQSYLVATADSAGNYYDSNQITNSMLFSPRFFFPNLNTYFLEDGTFSDAFAASSGAIIVEPMLAIWDSWITYGTEQEFNESLHASNMKSGNCFRLLYGQSQIGEVSAITSAKWINTIYVQYTGAPSVDAGDDLNLKISSDYTVSANVSARDDTLTELFEDSIRWSSSDESVLKVDAKTGKITVVGEGTAVITATTKVEGVSATDSITVTISADADEDLEGGGNGDGTGSGTGDGEGTGTGEGTGETVGSGDQGNGSGDGEGTTPGGTEDTENIADEDEMIAEEGAESETAEESESEIVEESETETAGEEKVEIVEGESTIENIGKTLRAIKLSLGEVSASEGQAGGQSGGGDTGNIVLSMTQQSMWRWAAVFAAGMFLCGGTMMYGKYKREL